MKKNILIFLCLVLLVSCELDNFDTPNASISGGIYDKETNELIPQDIFNGTRIRFIEHGFDNPTAQYMVFKVNGTYQNNLMFSNTYTMNLESGNYVSVDDVDVEVKGDTNFDFYVLPYIRVKNVNIENTGKTIQATFNLEQTTSDPISAISLYAHQDPQVGAYHHQAVKTQSLNRTVTSDETFTLNIDLDSNSSTLKRDNQYFFRVGAISSASQAKYNFALAIRVTI